MEIKTPWLKDKNAGIVKIRDASGDTVTRTGNPASVYDEYGAGTVDSLSISLNPTQAGTGDPSPSNVRPISGHNYASVGIAGTNLLSTPDTFSNWRMASPTAGNEPVLVQDSPTNYVHFPDVATTTIQQAAICERRIPYFMIRNKTLTFSLDVRVASGATTDLIIQYEVYANATGGSRTIYTNRDFDIATGTGNWVHLTQTRTFTDDMFINGSGNPNFETCYVRASVWKQHTIGATAGFDIRNPQLEFGSTGTTFVASPSLMETMTPIGQTVYGGTVDLTTGVLTVDRVSVDMGSLTWTYESATNCMITPALSGLKLPTSDNVAVDAITAVAKIIPASQRTAVSGVRAYVFTGNRQMLFRDTGYTNSSAFKTAMNGNNIVYALETPQTIQLTPQEVSTLMGTNYISTDGNVTVTVTMPGWTSLIDPSKIKHDVYDLDAGNTTGRNLAGELLRDRVAVKEKLNMEFPPMVADDYYAMLNLTKDQFFDVLYYSPFTGGKRVATMYVGDREGEPYYEYDVSDVGNNMWTNVKFNFIER